MTNAMQKHKPKGRKAAARLADLRMTENRRFCLEFNDFNGKLKVLAKKMCFGVPWGALGAALGGEVGTGGDHFGAMGPLWWVLGCLWGAFGVLLGRLWGPKMPPGKL